MKDFRFKVPQNIEFGVGSLKKLPEILNESKSEHVFLISDEGLAKLGVVKKVQDIVEADGLKCTTYLGVVPNPTVDVVNESTKCYKESGATSIIALGGGSSMDVAKATGVLATYGGKITDYEGLYKVPGPIVPIIAIPTTAGTGSEVTASAVVTDEERNYKMSVISYEMLPKYAVLDPQLIMTAPASIAASCGVDALIHALEAYVSNFASPFTDAMAEKAMELIGANIRRFVANRQDEEAACAMMTGSTFAGMAFAWAKLGNVHAMSHPVSAYFHVPHGVANAVLLPFVLESYGDTIHSKLARLALTAGVADSSTPEKEAAHAFIQAVKDMKKRFNIGDTIPEIKEEDIPKLAHYADKEGNPLYPVPVLMDAHELEKFYYILMDKKQEDTSNESE